MTIINFKEKQQDRNPSLSKSKSFERNFFTVNNTENVVSFSKTKKNESFELAKEKSRQSSLKIKW
ncbi:hypothetical protein I6I42_00980 [Morganella morganii]|uniref:hypothetical protein n=1 Tax=Morganella morganii TaxID=582 RepID=UPI00191CB5FB|nr:hypothetical protein [Morganella morganii]QQU41089.1 hypothetical protein I6I42_00980 [Morganella morganii]